MLRHALLILAAILVALLGVLAVPAYRYLMWAGDVEDVRFESADGTAISGSVIVPAGDGPHPAVVFMHGSGPDTRGLPGYRVNAQPLVRAGFAVLTYDKRGSGKSGGDFETAAFKDFVADAAAGVAYLRTRRDMDPDRIGLMGFSEGGWLTPEVAERSGNIRFIINKCGSPMSWIDTVAWELENEFRDAGLDADLVEELVLVRLNIWNYYLNANIIGPEPTASQRAMIEDRIETLRADPRLASQSIPFEEYDEDVYRRWAADIAYDPTPFIRATSTPILYLFGEYDVNVPTQESVEHIEILSAERRPQLAYWVFPDEGHSLQKWSRWWTAGFPDEYEEIVLGWARASMNDE